MIFNVHGTGTLRFLLGPQMKIVGSQMLISQKWYELLPEDEPMKFESNLTCSTYKKVYKNQSLIGVLIDIRWKDTENKNELTMREIQSVFLKTERVLSQMIYLENTDYIEGEGGVSSYSLRPQAVLNGQSELVQVLEDPQKVEFILNKMKNETQSILESCSETIIEIIDS